MPEAVIVYGISNAGVRIAHCLHDLGHPVTLVGCPADQQVLSRTEAEGITVLCADTGDFRLLARLGLATARSLVLPSEDELFNLQAALYAVEINPRITIVIRLFNLNLAKKLEECVGNFRVLSASQVASPSFTAAAVIKKNLLSFELHKTIHSLFETDSRRFAGRTVADIQQQESVIVVSVNQDLFPAESVVVQAGDRLALFSPLSQAKKLSPPAGDDAADGAPPGQTVTPDGFLASFKRLDRIAAGTLAILAALALLSIVALHFSEGMGFFNAAYVVLAMLTSGGFEDTAYRDYHQLSKFLIMLLMAAGVSAVVFLFALVSDVLLKKRFDLLMGRKKHRIRDHVILCGIGDVGIRILEDLLVLGEKVVIIEKNADGRYLGAVTRRDVPLVISDATLEETLVNANIAGAKSIICATDDDMKNLEIGLNARSFHPGIQVVLRIFNKEFAEKIEKHFNIHVALSSSSIAAPTFASAATDLGVINMVALAGRSLVLKERIARAGGDGPIVGPGSAKILLVVRNGKDFLFRNGSGVEPGDRLIYLEMMETAVPGGAADATSMKR